MPETNPALTKAGFVLARVVVPVWILTGALFKLFEHTPAVLPPKTVLYLGKEMGVDIYLYLATLIAIEFVAAVTMLLIGRVARPVGIAVLSIFCLVLLGEIVQGNWKSCGCMGAASPPPILMLAIDAAFLAGLIFLPKPAPGGSPPRWPLPAALIATLAGIYASFAVILPARQAVDVERPPIQDNGEEPQGYPRLLPTDGFWFTPADLSEWVGKPWHEIDLLRFLDPRPRDLEGPKRYVVFYSRTCDHCLDMFNFDLTDDVLAAMVTVVEVPDSKTLLTSPDGWPMPQTACEHLELPLGYDWIMTTPVALRVENGVVTCAQEGGHEDCLELE
jgi:uncharacterized membrane protein YphA (DoxX/SURF4 family)